MSKYDVLAARLQNELYTLDKVVATAQAQIGKAQRTQPFAMG